MSGNCQHEDWEEGLSQPSVSVSMGVCVCVGVREREALGNKNQERRL